MVVPHSFYVLIMDLVVRCGMFEFRDFLYIDIYIAKPLYLNFDLTFFDSPLGFMMQFV